MHRRRIRKKGSIFCENVVCDMVPSEDGICKPRFYMIHDVSILLNMYNSGQLIRMLVIRIVCYTTINTVGPNI